MKIAKAPVIRTGFFIIVCFSLLVVAVFVIGDKQQLFSNTFTYYAKFQDISGLKSGAQVQISGINIGTVNDISIPKQAGDSVVLTLSLLKDALPLIHSDSRAKVITEGLVGNRAVTITVGTKDEPKLAPKSFIIGESGFDLSGVMDSVTDMVGNTNTLLRNVNTLISDIGTGKGTLGSLLTDKSLYTELTKTISSTNLLLNNISETVGTANTSLKTITAEAQRGASAISNILEKLQTGNGSIAKLVNDSLLYHELATGLHSLSNSMYNIRDMMAKLSKSAGNAEEVTEALKHNFLVKSYFEDRGYWDMKNYGSELDRKLDSLRSIENRLNERGKP